MPISNTRVSGTFRPLRDGILVRNMEFGETRTAGGIIVPGDDGDLRGIHPRWAEVIAVGDTQQDVSVGDWILVAHGRWSRGFELNGETVRTVDPGDVLMISDQAHTEWTPPSMGHQTHD